MERKAGKYLLIAYGLVVLHASSSAQFNARLDYAASYDDNIYLSPEKDGDLLHDLDLTLDYTFRDSATNLYYNIDFLAYINNPVRNLLLNKAGIRYTRDLGKNEQHRLYLGSYLQDRKNTESYYYYDYKEMYLYANQRFLLNRTCLRTGYNFRYRRYENVMELTNFQHYAYLQLNRTFRTRTTLFLEADLGFKSFYTTTTYTPVTVSDGKGGKGSVHYTVVEEQIPNMSHVILLLRIAQSLHDRVGIYMQYRGQFSMNDASRVNSGSYFQDEELFDDPFSYTSSGLSSQLTVVLAKNLNIRAGGGITGKDYISETSFVSAEDSTGSGDLREDMRINGFLNVSKTFHLNKLWMESIQPYVNYSYVNNISNSYWYDYNYHFIGMGVIFNW